MQALVKYLLIFIFLVFENSNAMIFSDADSASGSTDQDSIVEEIFIDAWWDALKKFFCDDVIMIPLILKNMLIAKGFNSSDIAIETVDYSLDIKKDKFSPIVNGIECSLVFIERENFWNISYFGRSSLCVIWNVLDKYSDIVGFWHNYFSCPQDSLAARYIQKIYSGMAYAGKISIDNADDTELREPMFEEKALFVKIFLVVTKAHPALKMIIGDLID